MKEPKIKDEGIHNGVPYVLLEDTGNFSVFKTFDCGQCFRFDPIQESSDEVYSVAGIAMGKSVTFSQDKKGVMITGSDSSDYNSIWKSYLSLDIDYDEIDKSITTALDQKGCEVMKRAADVSAGIRLLRQEPWEALCSFIISQNNNIPRIKKIIRALCENFGKETENGGGFVFPTPEALASAGEEKIFALKTGFRAGYIYDAACRVASGEIDLNLIAKTEDYSKCEAELMKIKGVGPKVAACALLFGFGKTEAYPIDTWMKKVAARYFESGPDPKLFGKYAGIAQQYLFYMERYIVSKEDHLSYKRESKADPIQELLVVQ